MYDDSLKTIECTIFDYALLEMQFEVRSRNRKSKNIQLSHMHSFSLICELKTEAKHSKSALEIDMLNCRRVQCKLVIQKPCCYKRPQSSVGHYNIFMWLKRKECMLESRVFAFMKRQDTFLFRYLFKLTATECQYLKKRTLKGDILNIKS